MRQGERGGEASRRGRQAGNRLKNFDERGNVIYNAGNGVNVRNCGGRSGPRELFKVFLSHSSNVHFFFSMVRALKHIEPWPTDVGSQFSRASAKSSSGTRHARTLGLGDGAARASALNMRLSLALSRDGNG